MEINKITPQIAGMLIGQTADLLWDGEFDRTGTLVEIQPETPDSNWLGFYCAGIGLLFYQYSDVIFHLRKLDNITEEEARDIYIIYTRSEWVTRPRWVDEDAKERLCKELWWKVSTGSHDAIRDRVIGTPAVWLYLLSKGFDLLGLIDSGFAKEIKP